MNIWLRKCKKCHRPYDIEKCPYCRDKKLNEEMENGRSD